MLNFVWLWAKAVNVAGDNEKSPATLYESKRGSRPPEDAMAFITVPDCAELVATYRGLLLPIVAKNVIGFKKPAGGITSADMNTLKNLYTAWEEAEGNAERSDNIRLTNVYIRDLTTQNGNVLDFPVNPPINGSIAGAILPMHTTIAVKLTTGLAGRAYRGRIYHIGLAEGDVTGDFITNARGNAIRDAYAALRSQVIANGTWQMVVISRQLNSVPRVVGVGTPVTQLVLTDYRVDTQRRRLIGEGE